MINANQRPLILSALIGLFTVSLCTAQDEPVGDASTTAAGDQSLAQRGVLIAPRAFRAAAARALPSIVVIESFGGSTVASGRMSGLRGQGEGNTTGVILTADGWIVTSTFNFLRQPPVVTVITPDGERRVARLAGRDDTRNLCLLKIEGVEDLPVPAIAPLDEVRVGQWAISVGVGYGDETPAISAGVISALGRASGRALQTDANLSPANYGGPLLDIEGRVLGICVPLNPTAPGPAAGVEWYDSGIGFAISLSDADAWLERLKQGERLSFGFLGVRAENKEGNVSIGEVNDDSPAATAGLEAGDQVLTLNDVKIMDTSQLGVELRRYLAGDEVTLKMLRGDQELSFTIALEASPSSTPEIPPIKLDPVVPDESSD